MLTGPGDNEAALQAVSLIRLSEGGLTIEALASDLGVSMALCRRLMILAASWGLVFSRVTPGKGKLWMVPEQYEKTLVASRERRKAQARARYLKRRSAALAGAGHHLVEPPDQPMVHRRVPAEGMPPPKTTAPASIFHVTKREVKSTY